MGLPQSPLNLDFISENQVTGMARNPDNRLRASYAKEQRRIERRLEKRYHYNRFARAERNSEHSHSAEALKQQHARWKASRRDR